MKVLMFGWEFPPHISGGLGTACFGLTKELSNLDLDITFVLPKIDGDYSNAPINVVGPHYVKEEIEKSAQEIALESSITKVEVNSSLHPYMDHKTYKEYIERLKREGKSIDEVAHQDNLFLDISGNYGPDLMNEVHRFGMIGKYLVKKDDYDVIHAHDWMTYQAGIEAKKASGKPLIVHVHATEFDRTGGNCNSEIYTIEKYGMDMADKIITVSKRTRDIVIHKYNQDPSKISVVYNAVEKDDLEAINKIIKLSSFNNDKIVLFLGRITHQKGPEYFLRAANIVLKKHKNVRFVMAGNGDMTPKMIELMAELGLTDRFHFTGFLKAPQREKLFAMSDLFVMPSVSEPFGITPLEAMKHNIPIIISKQSGIGEILDHVIKIDFWDVDKLSESVSHVLTDVESTKDMIKMNRSTLDTINWSSAAKLVRDIYHEFR
jgi:glycogen synthase